MKPRLAFLCKKVKFNKKCLLDVKNLGIHYLELKSLPSKCRIMLVVDIEYDRVTEIGEHKIEVYIADADGNRVMSPILVEEEFLEQAEALGFYRELNPVFRKYGPHKVEILVDKCHFTSIPLTIAPKRKTEPNFVKGRIYLDGDKQEDDLVSEKQKLAERIWAYSELGMLEEAIVECKKLIRIDSKDPGSCMELAICYEHAKQLDEAIKHYRVVISNFPDYSRAYVNLGYLFEKYKKRDDLAIVCYEKAFQLNPQDEWALNNIGAILQKQGKWGEALDWYSKAYNANKKSTHILHNLGWAYYRYGNYKKALLIYRSLAEKNSDNAAIFSDLGCVNYKMKRYKMALRYFKKALNIKPENRRYKRQCRTVLAKI